MTIRLEAQPVKTSGRPGKYSHLYMIRCLGSLEFGSLEFRGGDCNTSNRIRNPLVCVCIGKSRITPFILPVLIIPHQEVLSKNVYKYLVDNSILILCSAKPCLSIIVNHLSSLRRSSPARPVYNHRGPPPFWVGWCFSGVFGVWIPAATCSPCSSCCSTMDSQQLRELPLVN